jgi:CRP-like cAMP-binding protein
MRMAIPESIARDEPNRFLSELSDHAYARVMLIAEPVNLGFKDVLSEADEIIEFAHFPQSGCLSIITVMGDGHQVEIGTVGRDGFTGISFANGVESVPTRCIVQIPGIAKRIGREAFATELRENREFAELAHRYAQAWTDQIGRSGTCNAVHSVVERCALWLLMTQDRVGSEVLPLTQEFLATMLGVRRPSVTLAAGSLQQAGLIHYTRGRITVLDRSGLEAASCECYRAIHASYRRLFPVVRNGATQQEPEAI